MSRGKCDFYAQVLLGRFRHRYNVRSFLGEGAKKRVYLTNGVREYIIWRTKAKAIDWFILRDGKYETLAAEGRIYKSEAFPGLWLDTAAMLGGDLAGVFAVLQQGMATPEHAAFVARLTSARQP